MKNLIVLFSFVGLISCGENQKSLPSSNKEIVKELSSKKEKINKRYVLPNIEVVETITFRLDEISDTTIGVMDEFNLAWSENMISISDANMWIWEYLSDVTESDESIKLTTESGGVVTLYHVGEITADFETNGKQIQIKGTEVIKESD